MKCKLVFIGRDAPAGNSCLSIVQNQVFSPDTIKRCSNREEILDAVLYFSHELSPRTAR